MEPLFLNQFSPADKAAWRAQVQKDLKDESAPDSLRWETPDGFTLEPYYTAEDLSGLPIDAIQSAQKTVPGWLNAPQRRLTGLKETNALAKTDLARGADALVFELPNSTTADALSRLLNGIKLSDTPVFFRADGPSDTFIKALQSVAPYQLKGGLLSDPLATWLQTGRLPTDALTASANATKATADSPQFRTLSGSGHVYHNAGATATQELAFVFSSLADQYDALTEAGLPVDQLAPKTILSLSVGTSYFIEIAKLRALRVLWQRFLSAYSPAVQPSEPYIMAQTSTFYNATVSPYTNLLRATTEAMAAVIGGCDVLTVLPYNEGFEQPTEFSDRIARNVSILLTEESYLNKVADPSAGSYYIETLTHELTESAWAYFLQVEAMGGLRKAFTTGFIQAELEASYQAKVDALANGRVMVGVNRFQESDVKNNSHPIPVADATTAGLSVQRLASIYE